MDGVSAPCAPDADGLVALSPTEGLLYVCATGRQGCAAAWVWYEPLPDDADGDGVSDAEDCNPTDPDVFPYAPERANGVDDDCDGRVDEGTVLVDDDGDGFTEEDGDCGDDDVRTYPGAPELQDNADNDCDGVIDEGTSASDDDGDGFSELELDCDDSDAHINPAQPEVCGDGIDNNCNGLEDRQEDCIPACYPLEVVGLVVEPTAVESGETVQVSVLSHQPQPACADESRLELYTESGEVASNPGGWVWTAPEVDEASVYRLYVLHEDAMYNQAWAFSEVWVHPEGTLRQPVTQ